MSNLPALSTKRNQQPAKREPAAPAKPLEWARVTSEDRKVPRPNGDFLLKRGKEINSANFDFDKLRNIGVTLEAIATPGWFLEAQRKGQEIAERLQGEGIPIDVPPDYVPPELKTPAAAT